MKRETAEMLSKLMLALGSQLNESVRRVQDAEPEAITRKYKLTVAEILGTALTNVMNPIYAEYPDLEPEELRRPGWSPEKGRPFNATHRLCIPEGPVEVMLYDARGGYAHTAEQWNAFQRGDGIPAPFWSFVGGHWWRSNERLDGIDVE